MKSQVMLLACHYAQRQQNQALRCTRLSSPGVLGLMSGTTLEDGKDRWDMFNMGKSLKIMKKKEMIILPREKGAQGRQMFYRFRKTRKQTYFGIREEKLN